MKSVGEGDQSKKSSDAKEVVTETLEINYLLCPCGAGQKLLSLYFNKGNFGGYQDKLSN